MKSVNRNYQKLKELSDIRELDTPSKIWKQNLRIPAGDIRVLRMLIKPKYGHFVIPNELCWIRAAILTLDAIDKEITGISNSWCYITIRSGRQFSQTDDEWHFDGLSFRTDTIPERNYIWTNKSPTEYINGRIEIPRGFDPVRHNIFKMVEKELGREPFPQANSLTKETWYLLSPFVFHRRPNIIDEGNRTFIRISFTDIEIRDAYNMQNPLLPTDAFGRNPVNSFRNKLSS